jgi:hypothetical protein
MSSLSIPHRLKRFWSKLRVLGAREAFKSLQGVFPRGSQSTFPLASADSDLILAADVNAIRDFVRRKKKGGQATKDQALTKDFATQFPQTFIDGPHRMRYSFFPSLEKSKGLVVVFHGYLGFEIQAIRYSWREFDLLLPFDNFGWKGLGSWFWGEHGNPFVETLTQNLIRDIRGKLNSPRWFATGASMGAFAALYHGIKHGSDGVYVTTPVINLRSKVEQYRQKQVETSYTYLASDQDFDLNDIPSVYREAERATSLPPLFLVQNQYDRTNPFGQDTLPLLQIYDKKKAWNGLRIHPAIGHQGHDGSYDEAQYFFSLIAAKIPPRVVDFYDQE